MKKVILISGGSDGLGYTIAKHLSPNNKVIICSPTKEKVKRAAGELGCDYEVCDISNNDSVESLVNNTIDKYGKIDCLINNAGVWIQGELTDNTPEKIERAINVNTTGQILLSRAVVPHMKKEKSGMIINIVSQAGFYGKAERSVYNASKFALTGFTKSLSYELSKYGIRVAGLYPGKLKSQMFRKAGIKKDVEDGVELEEIAKTIEFILSMKETTVFPEIGIKHIDN